MNRKFNKRQSGSALIALLVGLAVIYFIAFYISVRGWGYMGYRGYHSSPSFMYFGGPKIYHSRNVRNGSIGGPNNRGGGFSGGK